MCHFIRPGSGTYERDNRSYGLTTLRRRHARLDGRVVVLDFRGKSGKDQHVVIRGRGAVRLLKELLARDGDPLFRCEAGDGTLARVRPEAVNGYIRDGMEGDFSAKDFRTWAGSLLCASALARAGPTGATFTKRVVSQAVRETSEALHNTPAVARASYIAPRILETFENGITLDGAVASVDALATRATLDAAEESLLGLLESQTKPS